ncbi:glycosyltransferase family 2 protein [Limnovirga soli]|uniref:Glycosyltransferase n=1 Tax=Limnovirga soli TaxID=2656915 RepID=A0A8J8JU26_9BACT|nr:glycosyltransferase [Limnovirga soli]NNV55865.1 glycosyltransferase [Limnovirga soli]
MDRIISFLADFFNIGILVFGITIFLSYIVLSYISMLALKKHLQKNSFQNTVPLLSSPHIPGISLIAPAYNEGKSIVENIRSLLSLHYATYEVIIVNDGSKDDSLQKMIEAYHLEKVVFAVNEQISSKKIRGIYKSVLPAFKKLIVVDKENGGKADALNAGINVATYNYLTCIDVDCVLEQDSLLKMIKPFLNNKKRVIASGGVIRIANSCVIENGKLVEVKVPSSYIARTQVIEYMRAFLIGRMAWSHLDGLLLISGAFGMFDKEIVIKCGGYNTKTVGEDMELVVRMRRYMHDNELIYKVSFIPDPLCWTEAPESFKILGRQRNRWTRGTMETLWIHRKMMFNSKYGLLGFLSFPYWFLYEYLAPIVEFVGVFFFFIFALLGMVNWPFFFLLLAFVYSFAIFFSMLSIFSEEFTFHQYTKKTDILKLVLTAFLEPVLFHPFIVSSSVQGNIDLIDGKKEWGEMTRTGFSKKKVVTNEPVPSPQ